MMIAWFAIIRFAVWLRYRVRVRGLRAIRAKGTSGILFLPNHPSFMDPAILLSRLWPPFRLRALADRSQIDRFFIRYLARKIDVLPLDYLGTDGIAVADPIRETIQDCIESLRRGDNLLLYPAGRLQRSRYEDLGANSAVATILHALPDVRVVLVRQRGLWGSRLSWVDGTEPSLGHMLKKAIGAMMLNLWFFSPRRDVNIELTEPDDIPRQAPRAEINAYLENVYNTDSSPNTYVPLTIWESGSSRVLPEPAQAQLTGDASHVPATTRNLVHEKLIELTGIESFDDTSRLAQDLGLDSLTAAELLAWLQGEFACPLTDVDALHTVGDILLAAAGQSVATRVASLKPVAKKWHTRFAQPNRPEGLADMTLPQALLAQAKRFPDCVLYADQTSGVRTYRDVLLASLVLHDSLAALPGQRVGLMMPASVGGAVLLHAMHFAGKTPAMINWTLGRRNLEHCLDVAKVERIVTAKALVDRLEAQGVDLEPLADKFVFLEEIGASLTRRKKLQSLLASRLTWKTLHQRAARVPDTAVVLFTSGSESLPKAVPLTHRNLLANVSDLCDCLRMDHDDALLGILPPFHSFGLTTSVVLPAALAIRCTFHSNPTEGAVLAQMVEAYRATLLPGTPTFLNGMIRLATAKQLAPLRLVVSGAEACPQRVYDAAEKLCPNAVIVEGYGATECAPVISASSESDPHPGTIGYPMRSLEIAIVNDDHSARVKPGERGLLLVRGPSVFGGYLHYQGPSPMTEFEGKSWYVTGDFVTQGTDGLMQFVGRQKRFIKLGGEMISLPAIEAVLDEQFSQHGSDDEGPGLAILAVGTDDAPEIVLVTRIAITREQANLAIRTAGLSGLHSVRRVETIKELPLLGTGKIDYRTLTASRNEPQT